MRWRILSEQAALGESRDLRIGARCPYTGENQRVNLQSTMQRSDPEQALGKAP
jgi:hypothetical protein